MRSHVLFRVIVLSVLLLMVASATPIYIPILVAVAGAFLLHPLVVRLTSFGWWPSPNGYGKGIAIICSILIAVAVMLVLAGFIVRPIIKEVVHLSENIPAILQSLQQVLSAFVQNINDSRLYSEELQGMIKDVLQNSMTIGLNFVKKMATFSIEVFSGIIDLIVIPVLMFFLLKDYRLLADNVLSLVDERYREKVRTLLTEVAQAIGGYLQGQILVCLFVGAMVFGGLFLLKIPYPFVLACLAGITEAIPIIGPILAAIPAILLGLTVSPMVACKTALFYFVVQQIENHIIVPKIMGGSIHLHPVIVITGLLLAGELYGVGGMILALPVIATVRILIKHFWWKEEGGVYEHKHG